MTESAANEQLQRVFIVYPSFREYVNRESGAPKETLAAWCRILSGCRTSDVRSVVDQIVAGDLQPKSQYDKPDVLPWTIRSAANAIRDKDTEQRRVAEMRKPKTRLAPEVESALADFRKSTAAPKPIRNSFNPKVL